MQLYARFRASSAKWAFPFALGIPLAYYFLNGGAPPPHNFGYAATIVSHPLEMTYAFAYATASGLAAWESGTLKADRIWELGSVRSRFHIAAEALTPVLSLSWLVLLTPVLIALVQTATFPTFASLLPLEMSLVVCIAHCVIGFAAGYRLPRLVAAPLMTVMTWVLVAFSASTTPFWLRHISGQYPEYLMFGEQATLGSLVPHILFAGGIAIGLCLLWLPFRPRLPRMALSLAAGLACCALAVSMAHGWNYNPPIEVDKAPMKCVGGNPQICMPEATAKSLPAVQRDTLSVLATMKTFGGIKEMPHSIVDDITTGRMSVASTPTRWRVGLTAGEQSDDLRLRIMDAAIQFPCSSPNLVVSREVRLWAATITGQIGEYDRRIGEEPPFAGQGEAQREVTRILRLPRAQQTEWYEERISSACGKGS
ncbi:hypothetical protein [Streptomyces sp. STR69]|uniref:hypothetical protein n=1 Tax=Streptomyces sp. STR69 TaxID=1796942 RepID=UPI0021C9CD6A|nr:hypothetical protein [Streptomyces sp. STR69]